MTLAVVEPHDVDVRGAPWITDPHGRRIRSNETAVRTERILAGFERSGCCSFHRVPELETDALTSVLNACHDRDYLAYLQDCSSGLTNMQSSLDDRYCRPGSEPHTPVFAGVFDIARGGVQTSLGAAQLLLAGTDAVYAACRPPGHHAGPNWSGGYCYLNNAMAAARYLLDAGVGALAVVDLDFHFGDGSSAIAKRWGDVLFCSVNASASAEYPWMEAEPREANQLLESFPVPPSEEEYFETLDRILEECSARAIHALVISLGYDLVEGDPHGRWSLSPDVFMRLGEALASADLPLCFVQEGGYAIDQLSECSMHLARGVARQGGGRR